MSEAKEKAAAALAELGLTIEAEFIPFSRSRNAGKDSTFKGPCLNWKVRVLHKGREILATDYSAGSGHCPAYKLSVKEAGGRDSLMRAELVEWECENGYPASRMGGLYRRPGSKPLMPEATDVLYSLVSDSDALDYGTFEEWAPNLGYDPDSRKAEAIYRTCLEFALKLRNAVGEAGLSTLREAFQDY